jgi:hypothetical protein
MACPALCPDLGAADLWPAREAVALSVAPRRRQLEPGTAARGVAARGEEPAAYQDGHPLLSTRRHRHLAGTPEMRRLQARLPVLQGFMADSLFRPTQLGHWALDDQRDGPAERVNEKIDIEWIDRKNQSSGTAKDKRIACHCI